jgi:DNA primase
MSDVSTSRMPNDDRQRVLDATDIVRLVGEHVSLRPKGAEFVGLCPFHDDHNPSMYVVPRKQIFHCFVCGAGGNAIDFLMRRHQMEFREALEALAERGGVELTPWRGGSGKSEGPGGDAGSGVTKRDLAAATRAATEFFRAILKHPQHGAAGRRAIGQRGVSAEMVEAFEMGAAPDRWEGLLTTLRRRGVSDEAMRRAGLAKTRSSGDGMYDAFRNRLIFPIHDQLGRPIAFGARILDPEDSPKYLNSPETPLFEKSATLYGLKQAASGIQRTRRAVVTEGYTDVIACHQHGFDNVVATLGTALTTRHAQSLKRLCDEVVLLFDADEAGMRAADRAVEVFFAEPLDVRIAVLPGGMDPDDLLRTEGGSEAFSSAIEGARDALDYRFDRFRDRLAEAGPSARARLIEEDMERLVDLGLRDLAPIRRRHVVRTLSRLAGVDEATILESMPSGRRRVREGARGAASESERRSWTPAEHALGCLLCEPSLRMDLDAETRRAVDPSAYAPGSVRAIAEVVGRLGEEATHAGGSEPTLEVVLGQLEDPEARRIATALEQATQRVTEGDVERLRSHLHACVRRAALAMERRRMEEAMREGGEASSEQIGERLAAMLEQRRERHERLGGDPLVMPRPVE